MTFPADNVTHLIHILTPTKTPSGEIYIQPPYEASDPASGLPASGSGPAQPVTSDRSGRQIPLYSEEADQIIKVLFGPFARGGLPSRCQIAMLKEMIAGHAALKPRQEAEVLADDLVREKLLARVLIEIANNGPTRDTPTNWLSKVNNTARQLGLKFAADPSWPINEDALGKQFATLAPLLEPHGVVLERHGTDRPRAWSVYLQADAPTRGAGCDGDVSGGTRPASEENFISDTSEPPVTRCGPLMLEAAPTGPDTPADFDAVTRPLNRIVQIPVLNGQKTGGEL